MVPVNKCGSSAFCGLCYSGAKGRRAYKGHYGYAKVKPSRRRDMAKFLQRRAAADADDGPCYDVPEPGKPMDKLEALFEFLTLTEWEDGETRERGTLIVFVEDGMWKACLSDKDSGRTCFYSSVAFDQLLAGLDKGLRQDSLEWRKKRVEEAKKTKRK